MPTDRSLGKWVAMPYEPPQDELANDGGTKYDGGKLRYDLLPPEWEEGLAQVLTMGAAKYGDNNWKEGINVDRLYGALRRHMGAWRKGERLDQESGLHHALHAAWNALAIYYFEREND